MLCPECGKSVGKSVTLCDECLARLTVLETEAPEPQEESAELEALPAAGFWLRIAAVFIDYLIVSVLAHALALLFADILQGTNLEAAFRKLASVDLIKLVFVGVVYYSFFEGSPLRASPGKRALGLLVLDENYRALDLPSAILRNITKAFLFFGFIGCAVRPRYRALHDTSSKTQVLADNNISLRRRVQIATAAVILLCTWEFAAGVQGDPMPSDLRRIVYEPPEQVSKIVKEKKETDQREEDIYKGEKKEVQFAKIGDAIIPVIDSVGVYRRYGSRPEINFLYFDEPLTKTQKDRFRGEREFLTRQAYRRLEVPEPRFAITVTFRENSKTCNQFTYSGVYVSFFEEEGVKTGEMVFSNWRDFERLTLLGCVHEVGTSVSGKLTSERTIVFPDKNRLTLKFNLSLETKLR